MEALTGKRLRRDLLLAFVTLGGLGCGLVLTALVLAIDTCRTGVRRDSAQLDLLNLQALLKDFHKRHHRLPSSEEGLGALVAEGMLEQWPLDPWGHPYRYVPWEGAPLVWSHGADGLPGGEDEDEDLWCQSPLNGRGCGWWLSSTRGPLGGSVRPSF